MKKVYVYIDENIGEKSIISCKGLLGYVSGLYLPHTFLFYPSTKKLIFKPKGGIESGVWRYEESTHLELSKLFGTRSIKQREHKGCFAYNPQNEGVVLFYESDPDVIEEYLRIRNISWETFRENIKPLRRMIARGLNCSRAYLQKELSWEVPDYIEDQQFERGITEVWIKKYFEQL